MSKYKNLIVKAFNDGVAVLKLDKAKMSALAVDANATKVGIAILLVPFVLNCILSAVLSGDFSSYISGFYLFRHLFLLDQFLLLVLSHKLFFIVIKEA